MIRFLLFLSMAITTSCSWTSTEGKQPREPRNKSEPELQSYSPGIWIDWSQKAVELDAKVVLRRGLLELLACAPNTREHESILTVCGRPRDVYHALGLIGLSPGAPVRYDEKTEKWLAPTGQSLHLEIRYDYKGRTRNVMAHTWLKSPETSRPPDQIKWVFSGSTTFADGRFGGDVEGTVVTVVDFESAVIAVGSLHTADNAALWLEANTDAIPPVGTTCRLIVSAIDRTIGLDLDNGGRLHLGDSQIGTADVARRFQELRKRGWAVAVHVAVAPATSEDVVQATFSGLVCTGIPMKAIQVTRAKVKDPLDDRSSARQSHTQSAGPSRVE